MKQIGRDLNVRYVLEGSVQCYGNRLCVNVQLIDAEIGGHLWVERFDKRVADLFDIQDEIGARLANQLGTRLIAAEAPRRTSARSRFVRRFRTGGPSDNSAYLAQRERRKAGVPEG